MQEVQPRDFDRENKGYLNRHDFNCYVIASLGFKPSRVDMSNENMISLEDAHLFVRNASENSTQDERRLNHIRDMFNSIAMGKGFISMHDIEVIARRLSPHLFSNKIIRCLFDNQGHITFQKFRHFLRIESSYTQ